MTRRRILLPISAMLVLSGSCLLGTACSRSRVSVAPPRSAIMLPALPPRPVFSLDQRIHAVAAQAQVELTIRQIQGTSAAFAKAGLPSTGPSRLCDRQTTAAIERSLAANADDLTITTQPVLTFFPLQIVNCTFAKQYAYIRDYVLMPDGRPDPQIRVILYGDVMEPIATVSAADATGGRHVVIHWFRAEHLDFLGSQVLSFTALTRDGQEPPVNKTFPWEEPLGRHFRGLHATATDLGPDDMLVVPTIQSLAYQPASIRDRVHAFTGPEYTEHRPTTDQDEAMAFLVTGRVIAVEPEPYIPKDAPQPAWLGKPVTIAMREQPLPAVIAHLQTQLGIPVTMDPNPAHATLPVSLIANQEPARAVLERLLPQTLLFPRITADALHLEWMDVQDHPGETLGMDLPATKRP